MGDRRLMSIGTFASACRLTVKALRHYDEQGLLPPAYVDARTGYRYYARSQARTAVTIALLRSLDVPLPAIRELIDADADRREALLMAHHERARRDLRRRRQALTALRQFATRGDLVGDAVRVRTEPTHTVARRTVRTTVSRMVDDSESAILDVLADLEAAGHPMGLPVMCINEEPTRTGDVVVHACVGVTEPSLRLDRSDVVTVAGGPMAWLVHRGSYDALGVAFHALFAWAIEMGRTPRGPVREIYMNDPASTPVAELRTQVLLPIDDVTG